MYEKKRERTKPVFTTSISKEETRYINVSPKAYEAIDLPVVHEEFGMFKLQYRNIMLPNRFVGNGFDEIPVASAMERYRTEAVRFAKQVMLATGYFNTHFPTEKPQTAINYTSLRLSYSNDIEFHFVSCRKGATNPFFNRRLFHSSFSIPFRFFPYRIIGHPRRCDFPMQK